MTFFATPKVRECIRDWQICVRKYEFDTYILDIKGLKLLRDEVIAPNEPQVFGVLQHLIESHDQVGAAVLGRLVPNMFAVEVPRAAAEAKVTDAYHELLRATPFLMSMDAHDNRQALVNLMRALKADPDHPLSRV